MSGAEGRIFEFPLSQKPLVLRRLIGITDQGSRSPDLEMFYDYEQQASPRFIDSRFHGLYQKVILPPFSPTGVMVTNLSQLADFFGSWSMRPHGG